ncbi:unnamed protein product [Brassica oleracea]
MICDDLSYTHEGVPDRFKTIEYYGFTSSYQIQIYPYSFIFNSFRSYSSPTQAAITKDLSLTVAEDLSTLCLVLYPTWLLWLVQFPLVRSHNILNKKGYSLTYVLCSVITQAIGLKKHMKRLNAPKHWMLDKLGVQTKGHLFP